jgi:hypothetical protein
MRKDKEYKKDRGIVTLDLIGGSNALNCETNAGYNA